MKIPCVICQEVWRESGYESWLAIKIYSFSNGYIEHMHPTSEITLAFSEQCFRLFYYVSNLKLFKNYKIRCSFDKQLVT